MLFLPANKRRQKEGIVNLYDTVKSHVTTRQAAEFYGLQVKPNGMLCCPFHPDRHPSMKVDIRYYCFGCHETGDVIDFVGKLFGLSPYEAAKKLAADFHIDPTTPASAAVSISAHKKMMQQRTKESECASILIDYECMLKERKARFAPSLDDDDWNIHFAEACEKLPYISHLIDTLYSADPEIRMNTAHDLLHSGALDSIQAQLDNWREELAHEDLTVHAA